MRHLRRNPTLAALLSAAMLLPLHVSSAAPAMHAMSETDLAEVSARGLTEDLLGVPGDGAPSGGTRVIDRMTTSLGKGLSFVDVETTLTGVIYDPARAKTFLNADGSITQILPNTIGEVSFDNIRVKGATPDASFGSISIKAIDLTGTSLKLAPKN